MPPGQINLYKTLYEAHDFLSLENISLKIRDGDTKSLGGILLTLGKRINLTEDFPGPEVLFHKKKG
jgi:hypothetical protein